VGSAAAIVRPVGEFDLSRERELAMELSSAIEDGRPLVVDLGETTFLDSTVLGVLLTAQQRCDLRGLGFAIALPEGSAHTVRNGLRLLGIHRYARLFDTVDDAVAHVTADPRIG
jgi:anti-anti-sigma factor